MLFDVVLKERRNIVSTDSIPALNSVLFCSGGSGYVDTLYHEMMAEKERIATEKAQWEMKLQVRFTPLVACYP